MSEGDAIRDGVRKAFREALGLDANAEVDGMRYQQGGWTSVGHMALITALEDRFEVQIDTEDMIKMASFEIACKTVERLKGVA